jgi:hypothetical protein
MSLDYDLTKIADEEELHNVGRGGNEPPFPTGSPEDIEGNRQWAITNGLIWATISVGMGTITEDNWQKFYQRIKVLERLTGEFLNTTVTEGVGVDSGPVVKPYFFTAQDIKRRIGLKTNVFPMVSDVKFRNQQIMRVMDEAKRDVNKAVAAMEQEAVPA